MCLFQVRRISSVRWTESLTTTASRLSPPVTRTAAAKAVGWPVCQPVLWISAVPLQTVPTHNTSGYRGNAARSGCVKTWTTQSFRMPSEVSCCPCGCLPGTTRKCFWWPRYLPSWYSWLVLQANGSQSPSSRPCVCSLHLDPHWVDTPQVDG